jgi:death-on-curing protein
MTVWLTLDNFRQLCFELAARASWIAAEPIPAFDTRFPGRLEACLEMPQQTFDNQPLYPTVEDQAAILFYLLNKNHPFANGNKRIALTALLVFLFLNGKWLVASQEDLFVFAMGVAGSDARSKDAIIHGIRIFLSEHVVTIEGPDEGMTR